jgi:hypothetical protein
MTALVLKVPVMGMVTMFPKTVGAPTVPPVPAVSTASGAVALKLADRLAGMVIFTVFSPASLVPPFAEIVMTGWFAALPVTKIRSLALLMVGYGLAVKVAVACPLTPGRLVVPPVPSLVRFIVIVSAVLSETVKVAIPVVLVVMIVGVMVISRPERDKGVEVPCF